MKSLFLCLIGVVGVALAYYPVPVTEKAYKPGQVYKYAYETQVLTGLPGASRSYSGLKVRSTIYIQFRSQTAAVMKLGRSPEEILIGKYHGDVPVGYEPSGPHTLEDFQLVPREDLEYLRQHLSRPVSFTYDRGQVRKIQVPSEDPKWSVDIKLGVLNLLPINLEALATPTLRAISQTEKLAGHYEVMEESLEGNCKTIYSVLRAPYMPVPTARSNAAYESQPGLLVTKVYDHSNCVTKPMNGHSWMHAEACSAYKRSEEAHDECIRHKALRAAGHTHYKLTGDHTGFIIQEAIHTSQYIFTPYTVEAGSAITYVIQKLRILPTEPFSGEISMPSGRKVIPSLVADMMPEQWQDQESARHGSEREAPIQEIVSEISGLLESFVRAVKEGRSTEEIVPILREIFHHLINTPPRQLRTIYNKFISRGSYDREAQETIIETLHDIIPYLGHEEAIKIIKDLIINQKVSTAQAVRMLIPLGLDAKPSEQNAELLMEVCKSRVVSNVAMLKKSCWLAVSNLIHRICKHSYTSVNSGLCTETRYLAPLRDVTVGSTNELENQLLLIKSLGNMGLESHLPVLAEIIMNRQRPLHVRVEAIFALKHIIEHQPEKVMALLTPIYRNINEDHELRIAAFVTIMQTGPKLPILELLVDQLKMEPSLHVGSFVYSYISSMSNATSQCMKQIVQDAKIALKFGKLYTPGMIYSKGFHNELYSTKLEAGITNEMYRIGSLDSVIPRAINTKYSLNLKGRKIEILEAGIRLEGVQSLVDKIFGYRGSFDNRNAAEVDQLTRRMNIVNRESDEPSIYANLKVFGREITFVDLYGADIVRGIMNEGMVSLPNIERKLREGYDLTFTKIQPLVMARTIVPTHAGLPLQLHLCGVKVITNKGVVRGSFEPALYQTQRLNIPNSLTLTADIVPRVVVDIVGNMTVKLATFSAGAGITAQLAVEKPIRGSVNIDIATKQLTVDMEPVETTELEVAKFEVKPVTYFIRTPFTSFVSRHAYVSGPSYYQEELITGEESSIPYEYTYETDCPAFGKRALYAARLNMPLPGAPHMPFNGYQLLAIRTRPITPRQVQFVLKLTNNAANIPRVQTSRWSIHSPSPIMSEQPYTYALYAAVKGQGDQVFHEALLSYQYSEYFKKQYVSLEVTGQEYIFNVNGRVLFPEIDVSIRRPLSELTGMLGNVEGELNIEWSHRQQAKKAVQIMFTSEKTAEQLEYEPQRLREIYETKRTPRQWRASESFTELRQMTFIVRNYEEIPEYLAEYMYKYHLYTMGKLWSYIGEHDVTFRSAPRYTPGQIKFITKLYPNNRQVDVIIESPQQKVSYLRLPLPFALEPLSYRRSVFTNYIQKVTGDTYCELYSNNQLRTFDAVNYTLPLKSCEHILAKDCSSDNAYTVVLSKDSTTNKKIVKIMTEGKTVEIMTPTKVIVDGAPINAQEEYIVRKDPSNASSKVVLKVMYDAANLVTVKAPETGLIVSSDGASVKIELPNRYRSKLCGLCGDFNSEMKDELVGPKREIYTNLHHFVKSYVIPNSCQVNGDYESYGAYRPYEYESEQGNAYNRAYEPESGVYGERTFEPESGVYGERPFEPESGVYGERTFEPESGVYGERTYEPESGVYGKRPWESGTGVFGPRGYGIGSNEYGVRPYDSEDESIQYSWPTNAYDYENPDFIRPELEDEFEESRLPVDTLFGHGTVRKTMVIETDQFPPQICFSVVPIVDCQQGYYPEPSVSKQLKETGFTCIDAREPSAVEKKREAMIRVLPEMATKTIHRKQIVEEPKQCTQRY